MKRVIIGVFGLLCSGVLLGSSGCGDAGNADAPTIDMPSSFTDDTGDASVSGSGGSGMASSSWNNPTGRAEYCFDLTAASGTIDLVMEDADEVVVLDASLTAGVGDDSTCGLSDVGAAGTWTVTIVATDFDGDATISFNAFD